MCNYSEVISSGNLKFGTRRIDGDKGIPSLYFIDSEGCFVRVRPYHDDGFAVIKKSSRNIYFLTDHEYRHTEHETGAKLAEKAPSGTKYDGQNLRTNSSPLRVVDYSDPGIKPHKGHYLTDKDELVRLYAELGIDINAFIDYCSNAEKSGNSNEFLKEQKSKIVGILKGRFPVK
ncbi:hypothetical protein GWK08_09695 [Leptobacterium flavescens]|uniref:Uncharacterized protein n=1 Tax=Leptobacterium flavescens TaxID=472055 RepID=A0A6P0UK14_9FLAO|nr:hypothetical protein [Leptobacterium flavescens]NER13711.1 hypothetical protein [Leptobacterium flavescens]